MFDSYIKTTTPTITNFDATTPPTMHYIEGYQNQFQFQSQPLHTVSWSSLSCCNVPDSVCANLENDCQSYIECFGHIPISKKCDIGYVFNSNSNICDSSKQALNYCKRNNLPNSLISTSPITTTATTNSLNLFTNSNILEIQTTISPTNNNNLLDVQNKSLKNIQKINPNLTWVDLVVPDSEYYSQPRVNIGKQQSLYGVLRETWFNLGTSSNLDSLLHDSRYPESPDEFLIMDSFEAPPNAADAYGQRLSAFFQANETGKYTFYISCDNECQLQLSSDISSKNLKTIAELNDGRFTSFRQWDKYPEYQMSQKIELTKNKMYYCQAIMKESTMGDNLSVGIKYPNGFSDLPARRNLFLIPYNNNNQTNIQKDTTNQNIKNLVTWDSNMGKKMIIPNNINTQSKSSKNSI